MYAASILQRRLTCSRRNSNAEEDIGSEAPPSNRMNVFTEIFASPRTWLFAEMVAGVRRPLHDLRRPAERRHEL